MSDFLPNQQLSRYNRYILNRILSGFEVSRDFNVYELVKVSVSYKCILPSENELVMETYYTIKEFLVANEFLVEKKEMSSYVLTGKGIRLKELGSIEKYEDKEVRKKRSILDILLFKNKNKPGDHPYKAMVEYYE